MRFLSVTFTALHFVVHIFFFFFLSFFLVSIAVGLLPDE